MIVYLALQGYHSVAQLLNCFFEVRTIDTMGCLGRGIFYLLSWIEGIHKLGYILFNALLVLTAYELTGSEGTWGSWSQVYSASSGVQGRSPSLTEPQAEVDGWGFTELRAVSVFISFITYRTKRKLCINGKNNSLKDKTEVSPYGVLCLKVALGMGQQLHVSMELLRSQCHRSQALACTFVFVQVPWRTFSKIPAAWSVPNKCTSFLSAPT